MKRALLALAAPAATLAPVAAAKQPAGGPPLDAAKPATYAIIGDTPYGAPQIENFPKTWPRSTPIPPSAW